jgi:hypothetical protein
MAIVRTILFEDAERIEFEERDPSIGYVGRGTEWKAGSRPANEEDLRSRAASALAANATFLALASPTNAQTVAQVQRLTRECSALIRLVLGRFEDTAGT